MTAKLKIAPSFFIALEIHKKKPNYKQTAKLKSIQLLPFPETSQASLAEVHSVF